VQNKITFWVAHGQKWPEGMKKFPNDFKQLIRSMLAFHSDRRLTIHEIMTHPWMKKKIPTPTEVKAFMEQQTMRLSSEAVN